MLTGAPEPFFDGVTAVCQPRRVLKNKHNRAVKKCSARVLSSILLSVAVPFLLGDGFLFRGGSRAGLL